MKPHGVVPSIAAFVRGVGDDLYHRHNMYVVGGLIVGNPDDTQESIEANLEFDLRYTIVNS